MNLILRPYQKESCDKLWQEILKGNNALLQAPTGAGKSAIVAYMSNMLCDTVPGGRVLIIIDREILASQLADSIRFFFPGLGVGVACASSGQKIDTSQQVTIATRQTIANHLDSMEPVHLTIADEAHLLRPYREGRKLDQYAKIIDRLWQYNGNMRLLGCTATPYRIGCGFIYGKANHPEDRPYWSNLTHKITYKELTDSGYLSSLDGEVLSSNIDLNSVDIMAGEYNLLQLSNVLGLHIETVGDAIASHASDRKKIMVFCVDIKHAESVAESIENAVAYHSKLDRGERDNVLESYMSKHGPRVICSVATLTTGFDYDKVDCILCARPTMSPALFMQMIGRGLRVAEGKENCLLVDLTKNTETHLPTNSLDNVFVKVPTGNGNGKAPGISYKICEGVNEDGSQCLAELHPKVCICPECGYRFESEIASSIPELKSVSFDSETEQEKDIFDMTVIGATIEPHKSAKTGKRLLKVKIELNDNFSRSSYVYDWICTPDEYSGFAVTAGRKKWRNFFPESPEMPETLEECLWLAESFIVPPSTATVYKDSRGYYELEKLNFETPF